MIRKPVLVLGGGSDIGLSIAKRFAAEGYPIQLAVRRPDTHEPVRADLALRCDVSVTLHQLDVLNSVDIEVFFDDLPETPGIVVCAVGLLGDQQEAEQNPEMAQLIVDSNFTGPMVVLEAVAVRLAALDHDTAIIAISSVAGDRGRAKNYWYGAAKAGFTAGLSGLRQRYVRSRLHVMTVKPGFVATRMTAGMDMPASLTGQPDEIATLVYRGLARKKYVVCPPIWRLVMLVLRSLPEAIFMKTKI